VQNFEDEFINANLCTICKFTKTNLYPKKRLQIYKNKFACTSSNILFELSKFKLHVRLM